MPTAPCALLSAICACLACVSLAASAQDAQQGPGKLPRAEQLIAVPVGGTHVPQQKRPQQVANPYEGDPAAIAQGRQLFQSMNCAGCHAPDGGGAIGPPLSDADWIYGGEPGQIFMTIMQGRPNGMPSFARALPEESVWKLVAYVRSLSKGPADSTVHAAERPPAQQSGKQ